MSRKAWLHFLRARLLSISYQRWDVFSKAKNRPPQAWTMSNNSCEMGVLASLSDAKYRACMISLVARYFMFPGLLRDRPPRSHKTSNSVGSTKAELLFLMFLLAANARTATSAGFPRMEAGATLALRALISMAFQSRLGFLMGCRLSPSTGGFSTCPFSRKSCLSALNPELKLGRKFNPRDPSEANMRLRWCASALLLGSFSSFSELFCRSGMASTY
mmetsp:Transcript_23096/g.48118  ORF Transcript_23096/g.48118 Transcript_23096/m.48118 type:complete len:217 (+) Transcript_23096:408-1058(+)